MPWLILPGLIGVGLGLLIIVRSANKIRGSFAGVRRREQPRFDWTGTPLSGELPFARRVVVDEVATWLVVSLQRASKLEHEGPLASARRSTPFVIRVGEEAIHVDPELATRETLTDQVPYEHLDEDARARLATFGEFDALLAESLPTDLVVSEEYLPGASTMSVAGTIVRAGGERDSAYRGVATTSRNTFITAGSRSQFVILFVVGILVGLLLVAFGVWLVREGVLDMRR